MSAASASKVWRFGSCRVIQDVQQGEGGGLSQQYRSRMALSAFKWAVPVEGEGFSSSCCICGFSPCLPRIELRAGHLEDVKVKGWGQEV